MKNKTTQEQLIELYEQQIQDLVMMSKIELGDDIIAKIKELKSQINKQQTAVEWLAEKYNYITWMRNRDEISAGTADEWRAKYLEQAKEMEEQQKKDAWEDGMRSDNGFFGTFEQYYNKTDGGNK
jgi:hypothetical protein